MIGEHGIESPVNQCLIDQAYALAKLLHNGQKRKYTGEPYINHPVEVAKIVSSVTDCWMCVSAAFLHDTIEDCGATVESLEAEWISPSVSRLVLELTDFSIKSDGNRAKRKELDRRYLARASDKAKTIKLADLISNSKSIAKHDPDFAKVYMAEKRELLKVLKGGDDKLYSIAEQIVNKYYGDL